MKIEKINNNKLRIIFTIKELENQNIDYQEFMSGSTKCENIISSLLFIAKDKLDFDIKNCNIEVETLEVLQGNFVVIVTKYEKKTSILKPKRKQGDIKNNYCIYEFSTLDSYLEFSNFLKKNFQDIYIIYQKDSEVYYIYNKYILIISGNDFSENSIKIFNSSITEFATFKSCSPILVSKIKELHNENLILNL